MFKPIGKSKILQNVVKKKENNTNLNKRGHNIPPPSINSQAIEQCLDIGSGIIMVQNHEEKFRRAIIPGIVTAFLPIPSLKKITLHSYNVL